MDIGWALAITLGLCITHLTISGRRLQKKQKGLPKSLAIEDETKIKKMKEGFRRLFRQLS
jgi:hypothetical protein